MLERLAWADLRAILQGFSVNLLRQNCVYFDFFADLAGAEVLFSLLKSTI